MAENQANPSKSSSVTIEYQGWSDKTANMVAKNKKMETVKEKILSTIKTNLDYYENKNNGKTLSPTVRILKDVEDYTAIILRCGTFPIWKNTVLKGKYDAKQLLNDLKNKVESDFFKREIENYIDKKSKNTSSSSKKSTKSKKSAKTKVADKFLSKNGYCNLDIS